MSASQYGPTFVEAGKEADGFPPSRALTGKALLEYDVSQDPNTLLGKRWICRGGSCLWIGQSGIGKSAITMQAAMSWALGRPFFGITPVRPLKSLIVQAENDHGDLAEFYRGTIEGLDLQTQAEQLEDSIVFVNEECRTGEKFCDHLLKLVFEHNPVLVWIDPLLAFLGGDVSDQETVSTFLRNWLNPIAKSTGIGLMLVHHTGKPARDPSSRNGFIGSDYAYLGIGSSELTNWARAVLTLREVEEGLYEFRGAKRGRRAGITAGDAEGASEANPIYLKHSDRGICWLRADAPGAEEQHNLEGRAGEIISTLESGRIYSTQELVQIVATSSGKKKSTVYRKGSPENRILNNVKKNGSIPHTPNFYRFQIPIDSKSIPSECDSKLPTAPLRGGGLEVLETIKQQKNLTANDFVLLTKINSKPERESTILAVAHKQGMGTAKAKRLLELAVHEGLLVRQRIGGKNHVVRPSGDDVL